MITITNLEAPRLNRSEIMRYAGCVYETKEIAALIDECIAEVQGKLSYRVCYQIFEIIREGELLCFGGIKTSSQTLKKALDGCEKILLFAATIGADMDRLILKYSRIQPSRAFMMQAIGTERIESLCDCLCARITQELNTAERTVRPRVSPGYGDIPLTMQKDIFQILDCPRQIGLTLNPQCIMSPTKSVTALAGIGCIRHNTKHPCDQCGHTDCKFRAQERKPK